MEYSGIVDATDSFWRLYCKSKLNDCTLENRLHEGLRTPRMRKHVQKMWKVTTLWSSNVHANSLLIALQSWSAPHGLCPLNQNVCTSCSLQPWSQLTTRPIARWPAFGKTSLKANKLMLDSCTFRSAVIRLRQTDNKLKFNLLITCYKIKRWLHYVSLTNKCIIFVLWNVRGGTSSAMLRRFVTSSHGLLRRNSSRIVSQCISQ